MKSFQIRSIKAREVLDSRGNPTVEAEVTLSAGAMGRAIVPSGASKGVFEALELRDGDKNRFLGKGVLKSVEIIHQRISPALCDRSFHSVAELDSILIEMDGTIQKSNLGANSILAVSMAFTHAVSRATQQPLFVVLNEMMGLQTKDLSLPIPMMNLLNGGVHANNGLEVQEFMIVPHGFAQFSEALRAGCEVFQHLKENLHAKHLSTAVGDEGGFAPALADTTEALELLIQAIETSGYRVGEQISLAMDVASSSFYSSEKQKYLIRHQGKSELSSQEMLHFYSDLVKRFPIVSIEDGLEEDDWNGWSELTSALGSQIQLVGDDLFVTQKSRVQKGIDVRAANAVLIKVNQVGSLKETFETMSLCRDQGYKAVTSHRSGETEDVTIAHLAVASGCGQIKTGSSSRSERTAKYNELLRIEGWGREMKREIPFSDVIRGR